MRDGMTLKSDPETSMYTLTGHSARLMDKVISMEKHGRQFVNAFYIDEKIAGLPRIARTSISSSI
jgi:hypothetical protein